MPERERVNFMDLRLNLRQNMGQSKPSWVLNVKKRR